MNNNKIRQIDKIIIYFFQKTKRFIIFRLLNIFLFKFIECRNKTSKGRNEILRYFVYKYYNIEIDKYTYHIMQFANKRTNLSKIGKFCSIGNNMSGVGPNHPMEFITTHPILYNKNRGFIVTNKTVLSKNDKVIIKNDVWTGDNVTILPGVIIGDGVIVGAGSVVTKDIPDYAVAVGNPARVIKYRYEQHIIDKLLKIKWWDWDDMKIKDNIKYFYNIDDFMKKYE